MKTRTLIWTICAASVGIAVFYGNNTAALIILCTFMIIYLLHSIEVKINRILDDRSIRVTEEDLAD